MKSPLLHPLEQERIKHLHSFDILDTLGDQYVDGITKIASFIAQTPISLVSLVDNDRQWFYSKQGLAAPETPRDVSFCGHAILQDDIFEVQNSLNDERFFDNPLVVGGPKVIFYAGIPLKTSLGLPIGTLCVIDHNPKKLSNEQIEMLKNLADQVIIFFEKMKSEKQTTLSNTRYQHIISSAQLGSWDWWLEDNKVHFDEIWCQMLGLKHDEIKMELSTWDSIVHPDDKEQCYRDIKNYFDGKTPFYQNIHRLKHANGEWVWILDRGMISEYAKDGKPVRFTGSHFDITREKTEEEIKIKLSTIKEKYIKHNKEKQTFFNFINDLLISETQSEYAFIGEIKTDKDGKEFLKTYALTDISWNEETKKFYQENAPKGLEFKNLDTLFGEVIKTRKYLLTNDAPNHPKAKGIPVGHPPLKKFLGIPFFHENKMIAMVGLANSKSGYSENMLFKISPIIDLVSELIHNHILEQELKNKNSQLQHQAKLVSLGTLAAGIGHEINNPLTIASMITSKFIQKGFNYINVDKDLKNLNDSLERISNIVKGLKTFSRNDSTSEHKNFNLVDAMNECIYMIKEIFSKQNIDLKLINNINTSGPLVFGNRGKIQQVFINLLNNAKDAIEKINNPQIEIKLSNDNNNFFINIFDNGPGIPDEILDKIFDPFFTTKDVQKGTGLGLSIVLEIIREHSGEINVITEKDSGTTFKIQIPISKSKENLEKIAIIESNDSVISEQIHKKLILVVDDEPILLESLIENLEEMNFEVIGAKNGQEALELLKSKKIDLIISDINMPIMNGKTLFYKFKELNLENTKFIFISGGYQKELEQSAEECFLQSDGFISKPFEYNELKNKINSYLKK